MAQIHWLRAVNGAFNTAADWSAGVVPGAGDDAILDAAGAAFTVSAAQNTTVNSVQTTSNALLDIQADFSATNGTGAGANDGAIRIENGHTLTLQGTVTNAGSIELFGTVSPTSIVLGPGGVTLDGGGAIFLNFTGGALQQIVPSASGSILTDVDNRISGQGVLGGPGLTIISETAGFLEAKGGLLTINTGANTIVNAGLIDAEGAPSYFGTPGQGVVESPVNNSGIVEADGVGSTMTFDAAVTGTGRAIISGGLLSFKAAFNQNVAFEATSAVLALGQSVNYTSLIAGFSTSGAESLDLGDIGFVGAGEATYSGTTGGGTLTVTDGTHTAHIRFEGNYLSEAFIASSDGHGGTSVTDSPKALHWLNPVNGSFQTGADWTDGLVPGPGADAILDAAGSLYTVTVSARQTVAGVQTAANAVLSVTGAFAATNGSDGGADAGRIAIGSGGTFTVGGTLDNTGLVTIAAYTGVAKLVVVGALSLTGGGEILMGDNANNIIVGASASAILTNVQNIIAGGGNLGDGELTLINGAAGKIESEDPTALLVINTGANTVANAGLIESAGAGATITSPVNNSGILKADGANLTVIGPVTGTGRAVVGGGTLSFQAAFNQDVTFEATSGVLALGQSVNYTSLIAGFSTSGAESLDLGDIGFVGAGEASYSGTTTSGTLTVTDGTHTAHIRLEGDYLSEAFIASSDGHGGTSVTDGPKALHWLNAVNGSFQTGADWTDGLVPGPGADAILDAPGSARYTVTASASQTVAGIQTAANAILSVTGAFSATSGSDGGADAGQIAIANGGTFSAGGTLNNTGLISLSASSGQARLVAAGDLTLIGGGELLLSNSAGNIIVGSSASATLDNVQNRIVGAGDVGDGELTLINGFRGTIESAGSSVLLIDTGANTIVNAGRIEATGAGATIMSPVDNGGELTAAGGNLTVNGAVTGFGDAAIAGGTLRFNAAFNEAVVFQASSGVLALAQSVNYTSLIYGFSASGGESLDLGDIGFVGAGEATYSGTTTSGVLTVTDGIHTAHIHLNGNYTASAFTAASDGAGGTSIVDQAKTQAAVIHRFVSAMASLGAEVGGPISMAAAAPVARQLMLTAPRTD